MSEIKITPEFIQEQRELLDKATPGPWEICFEPGKHIFIGSKNPKPRGICIIPNGGMDEQQKLDNAAEIVAAVNAHGAMLDEIERLRTELADVIQLIGEIATRLPDEIDWHMYTCSYTHGRGAPCDCGGDELHRRVVGKKAEGK